MNREIKFRLWDKEQKIMLTPLSPVWFEENYWGDDDFAACARFCESVLMQFTGLLDKNGTPIYEADIIRDENGNKKEVKVEMDYNSDYGTVCIGYIFPKGDIEIIGNVWENPELIN